LILGVNGQDGSYLTEFLLAKNYEVIGWVPETTPVSYENIEHVLDRITLIKGDLQDQTSLQACLQEYFPDEIYNLASPSSPASSWDKTIEVGEITALGVGRLLESIRLVKPDARFYQASTSELFGIPLQVPQNELTPFAPRNPYGIAKLYAHWLTVRYRLNFDMFTVSGILFNHESPRRGLEFVTRKITNTAAKIKLGLANELRLGNMDASRDWGFAGDFVKAMWMMLQMENPEDYVIGTGETHSVREFCELAFNYLNLECRDYVVVDQGLIRPPEQQQLVSDSRKAADRLGWKPEVGFNKIVKMMVEADLRALGTS
jgi:GDPmannose 4,6-dehydratase